MKNFTYYNPTTIHFGRDQEKNVGKIIKSYGFSRVLIHYGQGSVIRSGLLDTVRQSLIEQAITFIEIGGVQPNPEISLIREVLPQLKNEKIDLVLALGGGSVIDSAKLIAHGYFYNGDPFDFSLHKTKPTKALPVGVILTISAAGSESSTSSVISDEFNHIKIGFNSDTNRPLFAIENPELTYSVSPTQTAAGIVDMMMHTIERYLNPSEEFELSDAIAEGLLHSIVGAGLKVMEEPNNYQARANLMLGSSLAHNGLTSLGKPSSMPVHLLEHALGGLYPRVTHGVGLAVLFPAWAKQYYQIDQAKFARFARRVFDVQEPDDEKAAFAGIVALENFYHKLGMPNNLKTFGVTEEALPLIVNHLFSDCDVIKHHLKPLDRNLALKIFRAAY